MEQSETSKRVREVRSEGVCDVRTAREARDSKMIRLDNKWVDCWTAWRIGLAFWQIQVIVASQIWRELLGGYGDVV